MKQDHHSESLKYEWKKQLEAGTTGTTSGSLKYRDTGTDHTDHRAPQILGGNED